jgi:anti-sigma28 factor (negative regulator of flagellin synthesis)
MRVHHRDAGEGLQRTIPAATADGPVAGSGRLDASAPNDAVQLSALGGVLNSLQTSAKNSAAKIDSVSRLIRQNNYQVDAIAISRKLIAASLQ